MQMLQSRARWKLVRIQRQPGLPALLQQTACATVIAPFRRPQLYQHIA